MHDPRASMLRPPADRQPLAGHRLRSAVEIGFDPAPGVEIGFDPQEKWLRSRATVRNGSVPRQNWLRSGARRRKWVCSRREMASIPTMRLGSIRIPDGFDPPNGSVPTSRPRPTGRPGAGWLSGVRGLGRAMRQPSSAKRRPDRINASRQGTVPRHYRGMRGRLITLPETIDGFCPLFTPRPLAEGPMQRRPSSLRVVPRSIPRHSPPLPNPLPQGERGSELLPLPLWERVGERGIVTRPETFEWPCVVSGAASHDLGGAC
jgi:hypothetical protein